MKRFLQKILIVTGFVSLSACNDIGLLGTDKESPKPGIRNEDPQTQSEQTSEDTAVNPSYLSYQLVEFDSCQKIEDHLKEVALTQLDLEKAWEIDHTTRLHKNKGEPIWDVEVMSDIGPVASRQESVSESADTAGSGQSGPQTHTETNNQVKGVEEADFLKNTGTHMFQIHGNKVHISQTWPADSMSIVKSIELLSEPYKLMLSENRLIVLSHPVYDQDYYGDIKENRGGGEILIEAQPDIASTEPYDPSRSGRPYIHYDRRRTAVNIYDISTVSDPKELYSYEIAGEVREARRVGNLIRLVATSYGYHTIPQMTWLRYDTKRDQLIPLDTKLAAIEANFEKNKAKIGAMVLSDFIQTRQLSKVSGADNPEKISDEICQKIFSVNANVANGLTNVLSIDVDNGAMDESLLLAAVNTLYMNEQSLYLVTPYYTKRDENLHKNSSFVHKFDLKAGIAAAYQGSGEVDGNPLNQFSLDEHNNILRIATTVTEREKSEDRFGFARGKTYNIISTVEATADGLNVLGKTENLAETERIYSVRYNGDWAYVVTFRQVDPLFTIDLSDPNAPKKVGELKIPGYSSYMQMLDDDHILAVGRDGTDEGRILGMKVSIFDVSDKSNPIEAATFALNDDSWSSSDAEWDHKAITYDPVSKILALPISQYFYAQTRRSDESATEFGQETFSSALYLFTIANDSITEKGVLRASHTSEAAANSWWLYNANKVRRSVIADNFVYAVSNAGIISAEMSDLASPLQVLTFPTE